MSEKQSSVKENHPNYFCEDGIIHTDRPLMSVSPCNSAFSPLFYVKLKQEQKSLEETSMGEREREERVVGRDNVCFKILVIFVVIP